MITYAGFLGVHPNNCTKTIEVYFDTEYNLLKMIDNPHKDLENKKFYPLNLRTNHSNEQGHTIRIIDIPLYVKSEIIKEYFTKQGNVTRFSTITRGS